VVVDAEWHSVSWQLQRWSLLIRSFRCSFFWLFLCSFIGKLIGCLIASNTFVARNMHLIYIANILLDEWNSNYLYGMHIVQYKINHDRY